MAKRNGYVAWINGQSWLVKLILFFPIWGWIFGGIYRLFEMKNVIDLVFAILWFVFNGIAGIIDFVSVILFKKPVLFVG